MGLLRKFSNLPSGSVVDFAGTAVPAGFLACDGTAVSRTQYSALFAAIGTAHGTGDGSTTFNLPDYRGAFRRTVCGAGTNDPDKLTRAAMAPGGNTGNNVGSIQSDQIRSHSHTVNGTNAVGSGGNPCTADNNNRPISTAATGGNETRPVNAYVNTYIKI